MPDPKEDTDQQIGSPGASCIVGQDETEDDIQTTSDSARDENEHEEAGTAQEPHSLNSGCSLEYCQYGLPCGVSKSKK